MQKTTSFVQIILKNNIKKKRKILKFVFYTFLNLINYIYIYYFIMTYSFKVTMKILGTW